MRQHEQLRTFPAHYVDKIWREHKRRAFSLHTKFKLDVAEKMAKVNVKEMAVGLNHDVVVVPIANA